MLTMHVFAADGVFFLIMYFNDQCRKLLVLASLRSPAAILPRSAAATACLVLGLVLRDVNFWANIASSVLQGALGIRGLVNYFANRRHGRRPYRAATASRTSG